MYGAKRGETSTEASRTLASDVQSASAVLHRIQCWKESGLRPTDVPRTGIRGVAGDDDIAKLARRLYPEYQRRLRVRGQLDYSDLTLTCLKLFDIFRGAFESGDRRADARLSQRKLRWKAAMAVNVSLRRHFEGYNALDLRLYDAAVGIWCGEFRKALAAGDSCVGAVAGLSVPALCSRKID